MTTDYYDAAGLQMYVNEGGYQSNGYPLYFLVPNVGASTAVSFNWGGELVSPSVPNLLWTTTPAVSWLLEFLLVFRLILV